MKETLIFQFKKQNASYFKKQYEFRMFMFTLISFTNSNLIKICQKVSFKKMNILI